MPYKNAPASEQLQQLGRQLEEWRKAHSRRSRLPEELWAGAVELARQQGLYRTARTLRLDYGNLKRKVEAAPGMRAAAPTAFVELMAPAGSLAADCLIQLEGARGSRMRIQMKMTPPEVVNLIRVWRDAEA